MNGTQRSIRSTTAAVAALAAALLIGSAAPAGAGPAIVEHWDDDETVLYPAGSTDFCDLGFDVVEHFQESGSFVGVTRGPDGVFYGAAKFNGTITWTNPANGRNYRNEYSGSDRDQKATDNGDGTFTVQVQLTGPNRYYANGKLAFIDTGMVRFTLLFRDGVDEPEFVSLDKITGLRQTDGRDFCADIVEFLG